MKNAIQTTVVIAVGVLVTGFFTNRAWADDYKSQLFGSVELIYDDQFDKDGPDAIPKHWDIRQETRWSVNDGVLVGETATKEYQEMMQKKNNVHDGSKPVIFLTPVPKAFVLRMRIRYDGEYADQSHQQLDLGHHVNSFFFEKDQTILTVQKQISSKSAKREKVVIKGEFFPINKWADVTIEIKEGVLMIQVDDRKEIIKHEWITLVKTKHEIQQIDFKGLDHGKVQIDWLKLYKGID